MLYVPLFKEIPINEKASSLSIDTDKSLFKVSILVCKEVMDFCCSFIFSCFEIASSLMILMLSNIFF